MYLAFNLAFIFGKNHFHIDTASSYLFFISCTDRVQSAIFESKHLSNAACIWKKKESAPRAAGTVSIIYQVCKHEIVGFVLLVNMLPTGS